jgi:hypothetical protein
MRQRLKPLSQGYIGKSQRAIPTCPSILNKICSPIKITRGTFGNALYLSFPRSEQPRVNFHPGPNLWWFFFDETFVVVWELTTTGLSDAILPAGGGFQNPKKKNPLQGYYS